MEDKMQFERNRNRVNNVDDENSTEDSTTEESTETEETLPTEDPATVRKHYNLLQWIFIKKKKNSFICDSFSHHSKDLSKFILNQLSAFFIFIFLNSNLNRMMLF